MLKKKYKNINKTNKIHKKLMTNLFFRIKIINLILTKNIVIKMKNQVYIFDQKVEIFKKMYLYINFFNK